MKEVILLLFSFLFLQYVYPQNVGIGTNNPAQKLEVNGGIKIGNTNNAVAGTVRWNSNKNDFEGYNGTDWISLTGGRSGWGSQLSNSVENVAAEVLLNASQNLSDRGNALGTSLATHGSYMVAGAPYDYDYGPNHFADAGTVRLFRKTAAGWTYYFGVDAQFPITDERFGYSTALYNDYMAVGAPGNNSSRGRVYLYQLDGNGEPVALTSLSPGDGVAGDEFGHSVALSGDKIIVGGYKKKIGNNAEQGRASIYIRNGSAWQYSQHLTAPDGKANERFGEVVAIDGNRVAISSQLMGGSDSGKVYVFSYNNSAWNYETTLTGHKSSEKFGSSLSLKGDTLVVGAMSISGTGTDTGKVYVYVRNGNTWQEQWAIQPEDATGNDLFGCSVYFYNGYLCVGARMKYLGSYPYAGKAYIFKLSAGNWHQQASLAPSIPHADMGFGAQVIMNGNAVFVGAPKTTFAGEEEHGRIYMYYHD